MSNATQNAPAPVEVNHHPFAWAGPGPYRVVRFERVVHKVPGEAPRAGSSCEHCYTAIMNVFWIQAGNGREFRVGSDCVLKSYRLAGMEPAQIRREFNTAKRDYKRKERSELRAKEKAQREADVAARIAAWKIENAELWAQIELLAAITEVGFAGVFGQDMRSLVERGYGLSEKQIALVQRLVFERSHPPARGHMGEPGKRSTFELTLTDVTVLDSITWGISYLHKFRDDAGRLAIWKTANRLGCAFPIEGTDSTAWAPIANGTRVTLTATVKVHNQYKGADQTVLIRAKLA